MASGSTSNERFLVTGAYGCIGVWVLRDLLARGATPVAFDVAAGSPRLGLVLDDEHHPDLIRVQGDITDLRALEQAMDDFDVTRVMHLAALQVPFCRADPPRGAAVNVLGTANVLEAARTRRHRVGHVVYASSIAAYDAYMPGRMPAMTGVPGTIYGVYKRANEQMAQRYLVDSGLPSIGLRPHTVFGPARDQGVTSAPTTAMLAAAAGRSYTIPYGGRAQFQYAPDVARAFVQAALVETDSADVFNLPGAVTSLDEVVEAIVSVCPEASGRISHLDEPLAFPEAVETDGLREALGVVDETPFAAAVAETLHRFRAALAQDRIDLTSLDR